MENFNFSFVRSTRSFIRLLEYIRAYNTRYPADKIHSGKSQINLETM